MISAFLSMVAAYFLALLFAGAAIHKIAYRAAFRENLAAYDILPSGSAHSSAHGSTQGAASGWVTASAWALVLAESAIALALLVSAWRLPAGLAAAALLLLYTLAMASVLWRGKREVSCGCSWGIADGSGAGDGDYITGGLLIRNLALVLIVALAVVPFASPSFAIAGGAWLTDSLYGQAVALFAALAGYLFYVTLPIALANQRRITAMRSAMQTARAAMSTMSERSA